MDTEKIDSNESPIPSDSETVPSKNETHATGAEKAPPTEIVISNERELANSASFDVNDIKDPEQREMVQTKYEEVLSNLADSIDAFRRQISANEGLFNEHSENLFNRYALAIVENLEQKQQSDITYLARLAQEIYLTINTLEKDNRSTLPTPDVFNGLIQAYEELDQSLHSTQLFLSELHDQIPHQAIQDTSDGLGRLRSIIEEKAEALASIRYLSEEYHG